MIMDSARSIPILCGLAWTFMDARTAVFKTGRGRPQKSIQVHIRALASAVSVDDSQ